MGNDDDNTIEQHIDYEINDTPMSEREYDLPLVEVAICLLSNGVLVPTDMTASLLEEGIDVETLTELYGN